jgi:hypothetical protein
MILQTKDKFSKEIEISSATLLTLSQSIVKYDKRPLVQFKLFNRRKILVF